MSHRLVHAIHTNLQVLEFDAFLKKEKKNKNTDFLRHLSNSPDLLLTTDKTPFHVVTYFLMQSLSKVGLHGKWFKELKGVYPVVDKTMESDFRKIVADFFSSLQKETDFHFKKNTFSRILMYPGKDSFLHLYLSFSNLVITKESSRETLQQIRSFKSHQSVDDSAMENISDISKVLTDTSEAKENLIAVIFEYKERLSDCQQERKSLMAVNDAVAAEWLAVFPEQDVGEGTCDRYIRQVLDLKSRLKHDVLGLVQQLDSDFRMNEERSSSLYSISGINVVRRMKEWTGAAKDAASSLRTVSESSVRKLCLKNQTTGQLVQKTNSEIGSMLKDVITRKESTIEGSKVLRDQVLNSHQMILVKRQIADQLGVHVPLDLDFTPIPVPSDGTRTWREREKLRTKSRSEGLGSKCVESMSLQPQTPVSPNFSDSPNFSLMNATVEISRMPGDFSLLDSSNNNPDFLLDVSAHTSVC